MAGVVTGEFSRKKVLREGYCEKKYPHLGCGRIGPSLRYDERGLSGKWFLGEGCCERKTKIFAEEVCRFGDVRFGDFRVAGCAETLQRICRGYGRARTGIRRAHHKSVLARSRNSESGEVTLRKAAQRSRTCGDYRGGFLVTAARDQCERQHSFDGEASGSQRAHGQFSASYRKERR